MKFLKSNLFSVLLLLASGILFIYNIYNNFHKPELPTTKVDNTLKLDSLRTKIEEDFRLKIDSVSRLYNNKIKNLEKENKQIDEEIKFLDNVWAFQHLFFSFKHCN